MKHLFAIVFGAGIFLTVCNAACSLRRPQYHGKPINGCLFGGKIHLFSSGWVTKECERCNCFSDGSIRCCTMLNLPMAIAGNDCEVLNDMKTCTFKIVYKNDHTKECP